MKNYIKLSSVSELMIIFVGNFEKNVDLIKNILPFLNFHPWGVSNRSKLEKSKIKIL